MINTPEKQYQPTEVSPPGETLAELLSERGISQALLAQRMGRPRKTINEIIQGKAMITPETALQLELVLDVPAEFWMAREQDYRTYLARQQANLELERDVKWARQFPYAAMAKYGWVEKVRGRIERARELLKFFGIASSEQWNAPTAATAAFRKTDRFATDLHALSAWLRAGETLAERARVAAYDRAGFLAALRYVRRLTVEPPEVFQSSLIERCAQVGVVVAFVPSLPKSRVSGATRWMSPERALIQLSLRYRTDDQLWFSFFHEAAHVLQGGKREWHVSGGVSDLENEANEWASSFLIPNESYYEFTDEGDFSEPAVLKFAGELAIAPGIVVGRLQHDKLIPFSCHSDLKRRLEWAH